jgi:hypothetical protein
MAKSRTDRRPARVHSVADPATRREIPAGLYKCQLCGRTRPVEFEQPGQPEPWRCCAEPCYRLSQDTSDKWRNPGSH